MLSNGKVYQDIWVKDRVVLQSGLYDKHGNKTQQGPECGSRYNVIKKHLPKPPKRMYVVDIGANYGYFGIRIAQEFSSAQVLLIEQDEVDLLQTIVKLNKVDDRVVIDPSLDFWIEQGLTKNDLQNRVTVLLLMNVLHHLPNWVEVVTKAQTFDYVFLMHPEDDDKQSEHQARIKDVGAVLRDTFDMKKVGEFDSHRTIGVKRPLYLIRGPYTGKAQ